MEPAASHPRRRPQKGTRSQPPSLSVSPQLRKVDTFHGRSRRLSDMIDPVADHAYIPKRAPTSSSALEDLIAPRSHIATLLNNVDKTLAGLADATALSDAEVWAVPQFLLENATGHDYMDIDEKSAVVADHHHDSDSGIGSSIESSRSSLVSDRSAVNSSFSATAEANDRRALSDYAAKEIRLRILDPLLQEKSLAPFHHLVSEIPRRIRNKEISNLRDLEKDLLLLSFDTAPSAASYLRFCDKTITCIFATVGQLPEEDQRAPTDRAYTNSYSLDLVDQIRRYAQLMAETRAREAAGRPMEEDDYSPDEEITIEGGLSHDGKPAQLVRKKDGRTIPIATVDEMDAIAKTSPLKRTADDLDDDAMRSMARRRKSAGPPDVQTCRDCKKEFKRPCDLTKHEKTHSRPWKCPESTCKYHHEGWPTEKEMQRHFNDRHTATPPMYRCQYGGCTYASKRESNCKQHMEKAHGYEYVRSKNTGRTRNSVSGPSSRTPSTPLTPFITTPASVMASTPSERFAPSPAMPNIPSAFDPVSVRHTPLMEPYGLGHQDYRRQSVTTAGTGMTWSSSHSPFNNSSSFEESMSPNEITFDHTINVNNTMGAPMFHQPSNQQLSTFQQPTPAWSPTDFDFNDSIQHVNSAQVDPLPHLSPIGQGDATLLTDEMNFDEALGGDAFMPSMSDMGDFELFPNGGTEQHGNSQSLFNGIDMFNNTADNQLFEDMGFNHN